jgi:hypothetical protein
MMRVTPARFTTLQFSQIGFTLLRTFTWTPKGRTILKCLEMPGFRADKQNSRPGALTQGPI